MPRTGPVAGSPGTPTLGIGRGTKGEVQRALFERNTAVGVVADGEGTVAHLVDVVVRDTRSRLTDGTSGWGLAVGARAQVDVARAVFDGNREVGIGTNGPASLLRFR